MQIGIDARLVFYNHAGIGQYIIRLIESLARKHSDEDKFVILQSRKDKANSIQANGFDRKSLWTPSHNRFEQFALSFEVSRLGLDLLHSPDFIPPFRRNCKSVITVHDLAFLLYPHFLTKESARYYGQIDHAWRNTDHIIAVSEATKQDSIKMLGVPESKITVIHEAANPIYKPLPTDEAKQYVKKRYKLDRDFILFVSTIEPRKNLPGLLQAYRCLLDDYKRNEMLVLAGGNGWLWEEVYETVDRLNLNSHVSFLGHVPSEDLVYIYNAANLFVHPAFYEGFGLPPLEAMSCGVPVIVSNTSAFPEVVGDAGIMINPHDLDGLTVAMWRILTEPELSEKLVKKGFKRAKSFSWDRAAEETLAVYHQVCD
ncbi:glycosyltransferase family 1 protein [Anaerolineales bacterium HSG24]|nr:glycosyltransferase family 1 protein [Anaerolineales bacterium HSG24]